MQFLSALFMILFISFDGFIWGWLIGFRRLYFPLGHFLLLTIGTGLILWAFYQVGSALEDVIPFHLFNKISGIFLLILSLYHLIDGKGLFKRAIALKLFIIINVDNVGFGLSAGFESLGRYFPLIAGAQFGLFFLLGLFISYRMSLYKFQQMGELLPFCILFSMGLFKLLFG
ncbi:hypothetical protein CR194_17820 [Salipaludibacillus keqinensis]|uniref:Sporulation membrane protein YtaF n=1 Tax=Salipaludibacillus keqinensis TaxID=2045207 RepID=A0A323T8Y0_9BACI|nr:hypothetical protein [Salipaludibacillus keqinensis]PYZ92051.1 hypothetical protein CR194_17820 [Salipaludibacillus keqinensis]